MGSKIMILMKCFLISSQSSEEDGHWHDSWCTCFRCGNYCRNQRHCTYISKNALKITCKETPKCCDLELVNKVTLYVLVQKTVVEPPPARESLVQVFNLLDTDVTVHFPGQNIFSEPIKSYEVKSLEPNTTALTC